MEEEPATARSSQRLSLGAVAIGVAVLVMGASAIVVLRARTKRPASMPPNVIVVDLHSGAIGPSATLSFNGYSTSGWGGNTCWVQPSGAQGCQDVAGPALTDDDYLPIPAGMVLEIEGDANSVTAQVLTGAGNIHETWVPITLSKDLGNLRSPILIDLAPGRFQLSITGHWYQGDREFVFPITIVDGPPSKAAPTA